MNKSISLLLVVLSVGCSQHGDSRLQGTYISDKEATLDYLSSVNYGTTQGIERLSQRLGKLRITFCGYTSVYSGLESYTNDFEIIESGTNHLVISSTYNGVAFTNRIDFTSDGFWSSTLDGRHPSYREKFQKVTTQTKAR